MPVQSKNPSVTGHGTNLVPQFSFLAFLESRQVVDGSIFYDRKEDKDEADPQVNIHSFNIRHPRHGGIDSSDDG